MAVAEQELRIAVVVSNQTAAGLAAVSRSVRGVIEGVDARLAGVVGRFEEAHARIARYTAPIAASFGQLRGHLHALGEETGLAAVAEGARGVTEHLRRAHEVATDFLRPLGALTALASVGGIAEAIKFSAERGEHLTLTSKATGLTVPQLGGLEYAANLADVPTARVVRSVELFNRNRGEVAAGRGSKELREVLGEAGVTAAMSPATALGQVEDKLKNLLETHQVEAASRVSGTLFGQRSGVATLPLYGQGSEHLGELAAEAAKHGQAPSENWAKRAAEFQESYKQMTAAVTGLGMAISGALFPKLTEIIGKMTDWVDANREWIATHIGDSVKTIADNFAAVNWSAIGAGLRDIASAAASIAGHLGFWPTLALIAGIKFSGAVLEFAALGRAVAVAAARLIVFPVAEFVASAALLIPSIAGIRDAFVALNLAIAANPVGAAIVAAALLAAAVYELYQHWDGVAAFFKKLWDDVVGYFQTAWGYISPIVDSINKTAGTIVGFLGGGEAGGRPVQRPAGSAPPPAGQAGLGPSAPGAPFVEYALTEDSAAPFDTAAFAAQIAAASDRRRGVTAKGQVDVNVTVDHRNRPPGSAVNVTAPSSTELDFGNLGPAFAW